MKYIVIAMLVTGTLAAAAQTTQTTTATAAATQPAAKVELIVQILRQIHAPDHKTDKATADLLAEGKHAVPAMEEALKLGEGLVGSDEFADVGDASYRKSKVMFLSNLRAKTLARAIVQIQAGYDPIKALNDWAAKREGDELAKKLPVEPVHIKDEALAKVFPGKLFYSMIIHHARPLRPTPGAWPKQNVFVLDEKGNVTHFDWTDALEKHFVQNLPAIKGDKDEQGAQAALAAWLAVGPVFANDGHFVFTQKTLGKIELGQDTFSITGQVEPAKDNPNRDRGHVKATLIFAKNGKLQSVEQEADLHEGMRPK